MRILCESTKFLWQIATRVYDRQNRSDSFVQEEFQKHELTRRSAPSDIVSAVHRHDFLRQKHLLLASKAVCSKTICSGNTLIRREQDAEICHSSRCGRIVKYSAHGGPYKMWCAKLYAPAARLISAGVRVGMYTSIRKYWSARMQLCVFKNESAKGRTHAEQSASPEALDRCSV